MSTTSPLRGAAAIVGASLGGVPMAPGRSALEILGEAVHGALADAGLKLSDVDGLFTGSSYHFLAGLSVAEYLGIHPKFCEATMVGGSSYVSHLLTAAMALHTGQCEVALICYGSNQGSGFGKLKSMAETPLYEAPYEPRYPISSYALAAARHMHQYGTTREDLAHIAVAARQWAQLNPLADARDPLSIEQVLASRLVSDPLSVLDCCLVTDGGGALVLVRSERARDFPKPPVYVLGAAAATWHRQIGSMPDLTVTAAAESGPRAFAMAGLAPKDVDVLELYDAFTINTLLFLEDLGFCAKGEGGAFVRNGRIAPGGALPVNTNGGGLSCCHPGMYGMFLLIEAVQQLRAEAGDRQVPNAEIALCHGNGGVLSSQVTALLGTAATV
ncbi:MAG: thiolase [Gammaproteobacteria bacterium]|uniref:thiolase n=1 Tax=Hydrogenophaga sp. TaxID=1904254 RepID=UPI0025BEB19F|nr:thiolase [Hydrogenophaga sp.]MBU4182490.1 thiolase [Gammaproteobacteria bacterium]MBU4282754.1 thiolase [Gammaproteobacteria bacterium]MBU4323132.1 thiolase [Gammaproteobacteria bacterium]MBU4505641.1 thiolase [Gammaproteobacteria bacterium]MCG2656118.1 thiolase [Hydrogenophaga sp.]